MKPIDRYKKQRASSWTRIDMLLALYDAGIRNVRQAIQADEQGDTNEARDRRLHAIRIVLEIMAGLDLEQGAIPLQVAQLCEFMQHSLLQGTREEMQGTLKVLTTLREGFEAIRGEAVQLERNGQIPPIQESTDVQRSA